MQSEESTYRYILYQYVTTCIGALAAIFNTLEIIYIRYSRYSRLNPIGVVYITNLALSHIFVGLMMIVLKAMNPFIDTKLQGELSTEIYNIIRFCLIRFSLLLSVFNLIALTVDRLCAIRFPFRHRSRQRSFSIKICVTIWTVSLILTSAFYAVLRICYNTDMERYKDIILPIATYPATLLFIVSYWTIFGVVKRTSMIMKLNDGGGSTLRIDQDAQSKEKLKRSNSGTDEVKFAALAIKTVSVFVVCWIPLSTISLIKSVSVDNYGGRRLESSLFTLALSNSVITPFVCFSHLWKAIKATWRQLVNKEESKRGVDLNLKFDFFSGSSYRTKDESFGIASTCTIGTPSLSMHRYKVTSDGQLTADTNVYRDKVVICNKSAFDADLTQKNNNQSIPDLNLHRDRVATIPSVHRIVNPHISSDKVTVHSQPRHQQSIPSLASDIVTDDDILDDIEKRIKFLD